MKNLSNRYSYEKNYSFDESTKKITYTDTNLYSIRNGRKYKTKMMVGDLPEYYCDVQRYCCNHDVIKSKDIKSLHYKWVRENHFMKDSVLRISYSGEIKEFPLTVNNIKSFFTEYSNVDEMIFGNDILKFLSYVKKYSDYDISKVKSEFVKHCEWLKENEPEFAPDSDDFGKWFDNKINDY